MLDKDLASLYDVKPIRLREQVKRNMKRFPDDFMFQLNEQEIDSMVSQNAIHLANILEAIIPTSSPSRELQCSTKKRSPFRRKARR